MLVIYQPQNLGTNQMKYIFTFTRMSILHNKMFAHYIVNQEKDHFSYIYIYNKSLTNITQ